MERDGDFVFLLTCFLKSYQKVNFVLELKQSHLKMFIIVILLLSHGHGGRDISLD